MDTLILAHKEFHSRLFLGTGKFSSKEIMEKEGVSLGTIVVDQKSQ